MLLPYFQKFFNQIKLKLPSFPKYVDFNEYKESIVSMSYTPPQKHYKKYNSLNGNVCVLPIEVDHSKLHVKFKNGKLFNELDSLIKNGNEFYVIFEMISNNGIYYLKRLDFGYDSDNSIVYDAYLIGR
jgi:hypothetical protein